MARYSGHVGFSRTVKSNGVSTEVISERGKYYGSVKTESLSFVRREKVNPDRTTGTRIEIMADAYASENFMAIKYVEWAGVYWEVAEVIPGRPRLTLRLGGVYNGDRAESQEPIGVPEAP